MTLSSQEAAENLSQAEEAGRRSKQVYFYRQSSPHLIIWGIIWVIGYGGTGLYPLYANPLWAGLVLIGCASSVVLGRCTKPDGTTGGPYPWRVAGLMAIIIFFVFATYAILQPHSGRQLAAYPALITGVAYVAVGLWTGPRYVVSGMVVAALTLIGFFYIGPIFLWFAVVGGGSMILTGLWFRTV
ncbi:MAG: hypothetical protein KGJ78_04535 [Alphaproteobacteria bacterium]|nr:hypothetical protein [Alphaproteobacteria bacterium]